MNRKRRGQKWSLGKLDNEVLVSVIDFVQTYDSPSQPNYGLEYLDHEDMLNELLAPDQPYPSIREVPNNTKMEWKSNLDRSPYSVKAIDDLQEVYGIRFPITYSSDGIGVLNIIAAYVFFSGYLSERHYFSISVPNSILNHIKGKLCLGSLDIRLSNIRSTYKEKDNKLIPKKGNALSRVFELLGLPMEKKSSINLSFPGYIQIAAEEVKKDSFREYKAQRLVNDFVKVMLLSKSRREGDILRVQLFNQPDKSSAEMLCKEAKEIISCVFPEPELLDHRVYYLKPRKSGIQREAGYEPRIYIRDVERVLEEYTDDERLVDWLS